MTQRPPDPRVAGFTLMEALVALAIAAIMLTAILQIEHQLVDGQRRADVIIRRANIEHDALALVKDVNPAQVDQGDMPMAGDMTLHWTSEAISDQKLTTGFPRGDGTYNATLYRLTVTVDDAKGQPAIPSFTVERVGWASGTLATDQAGAGAATGAGGAGAGGAGAAGGGAGRAGR